MNNPIKTYAPKSPLIRDLKKCFEILGMRPTTILDEVYFNSSSKKLLTRHRIRIRRHKDIIRWCSLIGTHNPKFYKWIKFFKDSIAPVV